MTTPPDPAQPGTGYGGAQYPPPGDPQYPSGQNPPGQYPPGQYSPNQYPPTQINPGQAPPAEPGYATGYGGARYPLPAGQEQPQPGGYAYNPYGPYGQGPAGLDDKEPPPATRPGTMVVSLVLLILSAAPFLLFGALVLLVPLEGVIPPEVFDNPQVVESQLTESTLITVIRLVGGVFLVVALLFAVFAVFAFLGHNWARILVTVMTVGFSVLLVLSLASGGATDLSSVAIILVPLLLAVGGTVVLFVSPAKEYFSSRRR